MPSRAANRKQFVSTNGAESSTEDMIFGVPQGSILGPLLFVIYINDLPGISDFANFILYADDANIIITADTIEEVFELTNKLLGLLKKWVDSNGLALNVKKTKYMLFSRSKTKFNTPLNFMGNEIEKLSEARFLGVIVDEKLNWSAHIKTVRSKMSRYVGIMYRIKSFLPIKARVQIFHSFIQSHLNFCCLVWGFACKSSIEKLFIAQKKGVRAIAEGYINYFYVDGELPGHTKPVFNCHNILNIYNIIALNSLIFIEKIRNFSSTIPESVKSIISPSAPDNKSNYESCSDWLAAYNTNIYRTSIMFKGPLLSRVENFSEIIACNITIFSIKKRLKQELLKMQCLGDSNEWDSKNFALLNIPGLRTSSRNA